MKRIILVLFVIGCANQFMILNSRSKDQNFCSDGSCSYQTGPMVSKTFCPSSGCPCTAKICKECEECPM